MSIRFKFRSSVNFDTVDIDGRDSISVRELRYKILNGKALGASLQQHQDFDLLLLDADSGRDYKDDDIQIPSGSSVIVKRVPAGTVPSAMVPIATVKDLGVKDSCQLNQVSKPADDFGADFCPLSDDYFPNFDLDCDKNNIGSSEKEDDAHLRLGHQKLKSSNVSQALPRGSNQNGNERSTLQEPKVEEQMKMAKLSTVNVLAFQNTNLPVELKCSLCNTFFKDAVMIPCCQHSFCEKCIRLVLIEKGRCPKCSSSKCKVENLLPNLSLRQAIEHCLETQILDAGLENAMEKYAPDGESGIQVKKDGSCALTVFQREVELPQSSSATGIGSNQIYPESYYKPLHRKNTSYRSSNNHVNVVDGSGDMTSALPTQKAKQMDAARDVYPHHAGAQRGLKDFAAPADFQCENQPSDIPQFHIHDEADSNAKKMGGVWIETGGGERNFTAHGGYKKVGRNCYACGSPDHLMRDCPVGSNLHPFQPGSGAFHGGVPNPGYAPPFWNGSIFPYRPYVNMYGNPAVMPFNVSMVPPTPFAVPRYVPSMGVGLDGPWGNMGPPSVGNRTQRPPSCNLELQHFEHIKKHSNENLGREKLRDEEDSQECHWEEKKSDKSHQHKTYKVKQHNSSQSEDSFTRRSQRKDQLEKYIDSDMRYIEERLEKSSRSSAALRDKRLHHSERSNSGIEDVSRSSDRYSERRHEDHHGEPKHHKRRVEYDSDSSLDHHPLQKDTRRDGYNARGSHVDLKGDCRDRDLGHNSRHSRHLKRHSRNDQHDDKCQMVSGSYDYRDEYHRDKRKRVLKPA